MITVLITNYNTVDFVEVSLQALARLTKNPYKVLINDNGSSPREKEKLQRLAARYSNVAVNWRVSAFGGSRAHGEALDVLIPMVDTPYFVILDSDCCLLLKGWDAVMLQQLNDRVKLMGTTSPIHRSGPRIGVGVFPLPFAVLLETKTFKDLGISCLPRNIQAGEDTCWQWKGAYTQAGYKAIILDSRNTRDYKDGAFRDMTGVGEYYFEGKLIASHFGRGSTEGEAKYLRGISVPFISRMIRRCLGTLEKSKWIHRCYSIIEAQA